MTPTKSWRQAAEGLAAELRQVVEGRLRSLVVYEAHGLLGDTAGEADIHHEDHVHSLALIDGFGYQDLARLAPLAAAWKKRGLAVPLFLAPGELRRSLDAFPLEFSQIVARHVVIAGEDPFANHEVAERDLRRACETQARSHLLHLREGFLEAAGSPRAVADLTAASVTPLRALLVNIARLHGVTARTPDALLHFIDDRLRLDTTALRPLLSKKPAQVRDLDAAGLFPAYLRAMEQLVTLVDEWTR